MPDQEDDKHSCVNLHYDLLMSLHRGLYIHDQGQIPASRSAVARRDTFGGCTRFLSSARATLWCMPPDTLPSATASADHQLVNCATHACGRAFPVAKTSPTVEAQNILGWRPCHAHQ